MADTPKKGWSEAEKLDLMFQIIHKTAKTIPWDQLNLRGRTVKACQSMLDREMTKVKKAHGAEPEISKSDGDDKASTPTPAKAKKKRTANTDGAKAEKKARTGKKKDPATDAESVGADGDDEIGRYDFKLED